MINPQFSKLLAGIAVGVGAGLRFDFSFLTQNRSCFIRKPYLQEGDRWVLDQVRLGASSAKENLVLTSPLAIHFNSAVTVFVLYCTLLLYKNHYQSNNNQMYCTVFMVQANASTINETI
jgi:hypothetical protein